MKKKQAIAVILTAMMTGASILPVSAMGITNMEQPGFMQQMGPMGGASNVTYESEPGEIITSDVQSTAQYLTVDEANITNIEMSEENNEVKITESGTYKITGTCSDGNITVKKGITGVVLILDDLDLTSTTEATLSCNKGSEVKIIVEGNVTLTDNENPADEEATDTEVADAYDGAALKVKDGADVYLTGTGTLNINGNAKNGIKIGDTDIPSFVIDGDMTLNITAANDGINGGYDVTILSGTINIDAEDDGIHADRILTIGEDGSGPDITINSNEGLEGTVVNLFGGSAAITTTDDAINAANSDGTYSADMEYSINITGGTWDVISEGDGLDSNGNINITGGSVSIQSRYAGGEAGIDYDGKLYVADGTLNNNSGISGPDMMGGMPGGMQGRNFQGRQTGRQNTGTDFQRNYDQTRPEIDITVNENDAVSGTEESGTEDTDNDVTIEVDETNDVQTKPASSLFFEQSAPNAPFGVQPANNFQKQQGRFNTQPENGLQIETQPQTGMQSPGMQQGRMQMGPGGTGMQGMRGQRR